MFYNYDKILSYNRLFSIILGERGNGKTYGFKKYAIKDFLKNGNQFIYLRRYKSEFSKINLFFNDIAHEFKGHEFKVSGGMFYIDGRVAGYYVNLSTSAKLKSTPFDKVNKIGFDEFIADGGYRYLKNEVEMLLDFIETVIRLRDNVRIFLIANSKTKANPYFTYFKIISLKNEFTKIGKHMVVHYTDSKEYRAEKKKTRFGEFISGTKYGDYAIENKFVYDLTSNIENKSSTSINYCNLKLDGITIGIWIDYKQSKFYATTGSYNENFRFNYALTPDDASEYFLYYNLGDIKRNDTHLKNLKQAFYNNIIYYNNERAKLLMYDIYKILGW